MSIVLFGGTDLTLAVAEHVLGLGVEIRALVYVGAEFSISYAPGDGVMNTRVAPIAAWCGHHDVPGFAYEGPEQLERLVRSSGSELGIAAGWYHMIPAATRDSFTHGCVGIHASLLPRLRGGAPLVWAMLAGERETGVSLFELGDGVDDGPIYAQAAFPIPERARIADLVAIAERTTLDLLDEHLPALLRGEARARSQKGEPSYSLQRRPEDGRIDWSRAADEIDLLIRAVGRPYPGARTLFDGAELVVWEAEPPAAKTKVLGVPGQIARLPGEDDPCVISGKGVLVLRDVTDAAGTSKLDLLRRAGNRRFDSYR